MSSVPDGAALVATLAAAITGGGIEVWLNSGVTLRMNAGDSACSGSAARNSASRSIRLRTSRTLPGQA